MLKYRGSFTQEDKMKTIEVVAAIIKRNHKFLCTQRINDGSYMSLKWEFPGGKIEENESPKEALKREIKEELRLDIEVKEFFFTVKHTYPNMRLIMHAFLCEMKQDTFTLEEHNSYRWLSPSELMTLDWAEADIPIVHEILKK